MKYTKKYQNFFSRLTAKTKKTGISAKFHRKIKPWALLARRSRYTAADSCVQCPGRPLLRSSSPGSVLGTPSVPKYRFRFSKNNFNQIYL